MKKGAPKKKDALPHLTPVLPTIDDAYVQAVKIQSLEERFVPLDQTVFVNFLPFGPASTSFVDENFILGIMHFERSLTIFVRS